uniref:Uncharacterized protein n=1 Tax=Ciona intestinalis TaxID=7719 RepID=H2XKC1_CIOIN
MACITVVIFTAEQQEKLLAVAAASDTNFQHLDDVIRISMDKAGYTLDSFNAKQYHYTFLYEKWQYSITKHLVLTSQIIGRLEEKGYRYKLTTVRSDSEQLVFVKS